MATKTAFKRVVFPFAAIVGQEKMKKALLLNAINPQVGGVLIRGEKGTGKSTAVRALAEPFANDGIQKVVGIESRGFIFGPSLAVALNAGFVLARKPGKLPRETVSETYALEYGEDSLEIHREDLLAGEKVLVVDDLLATGGTASAVLRLVRRLEAQVVGMAFVIELEFLKGREKIVGPKINALVRY